jgi:hypothetical protein
MDVYTIYSDHTEECTAHEFVRYMNKFMDKLVEGGRMESYRITRMKLGFRSMELPEFRIDMEFKNMQQLDDAMSSVVTNENKIEDEHHGFNKYVELETIQHFLYRDFPDDLTKHRESLNDK